MDKCMEFKLCCPRCGLPNFEVKELPLIEVDGMTYLVDNPNVICESCGLAMSISGLIVAVIQKDYIKDGGINIEENIK